MLRAFWSMISKNPRFRPNTVKIFRVPPLHIFYPWLLVRAAKKLDVFFHFFFLFWNSVLKAISTLQKLEMKLLLLSWPHSFHQPLKSLIWQGSISSAPSKERELKAASSSPSPAPDATWTRVDKKLCLASGPQPWYQEATTCIWVPARPWSPLIVV